jgi:hypothetical protein
MLRGGNDMGNKSQWAVRSMKCPEEEQTVDLLVEWKVERGKRILQSVSCNHPALSDYSGKECQWVCLPRLSGGKK